MKLLKNSVPKFSSKIKVQEWLEADYGPIDF